MVGPFGLRPRTTMRARALPLGRALVERGHRVTMLLPPWQNPEDAGRAWEDCAHAEHGVQIENMPLPVRLPGWFQSKLTWALVRRALVLQPDVIHGFKPKAYAGLVHRCLALCVPRLPVVVDTDDWEGPGGWNDLNPYAPGLQRVFAWQERWGLRHADAVTVASRALQTLTWAMGGTPERVFYLPNGVEETGTTYEEEVALSSDSRPVLLLYTRFFEFDVRRLWRIVRRIRDRCPDVRLLVVGKGLFDEEGVLLTLAQDTGWRILNSHYDWHEDFGDADLIYTGWVPYENLSMYFTQADVALYPFDDTLINRTKCPVKLLDLLRAGVPVVGDAVGQIVENIRPGETGLLVPPGDDVAFAEAVLTLLEDEALRCAMSLRARQDVRERFAWHKLAAVAESAYLYAQG
jgi:glycosyltransferase involved in cell wall biosynthesis